MEIRFDKRWGRGVYFDFNDISEIPGECKLDENGTIFLKENIIIGYYGGVIRHNDEWRKHKREYFTNNENNKLTDKFQYSCKFNGFD